MKQKLFRLADILKDEIKCHEDLLAFAYKKERVIINNNVDELKAITLEEEKIISAIKTHEDERTTVVKALAKSFNCSPKKFTLGVLIEKLDSDIALEFKLIHQELVDLLQKLKRMNERNSRLIKTSLELVSYSMNLYVTLNSGPKVYGNKGSVASTPKRNSLIFDKTV